MEQGPVGLYLVLLVVCLFLSGLLSGSEAALLTLQRVKLHQMLERRVPGARLVARLVEDPQRFLPTVLLANNLVNTAAAALGTAIALAFIKSQDRAVLAATAGVTVLLLLFGETLPKAVGVRHPEVASRLVARPVVVLGRVLFPLTFVLNWVIQRAMSLLGGGVPRDLVTEEELRLMISLGGRSGALDTGEARLLDRVFRLGDRQVREVMTPRTEIAWLEEGATLERFLAAYARQPHSRFPVSKESFDNIVGILWIRDVLRGMTTRRIHSGSDVTVLARPATFTPETKPVAHLLRELQESGQTMAVAVDEFGVVTGVITATQIVEEVMGPLHEEDVPSEEEFFSLNDRTFLVDGSARLHEVNERLGISLPEGEYETIAGFLLSALGRIPRAGEEYWHGGVHLVATRMRGLRIERVRISLPAASVGAQDSDAT